MFTLFARKKTAAHEHAHADTQTSRIAARPGISYSNTSIRITMSEDRLQLLSTAGRAPNYCAIFWPLYSYEDGALARHQLMAAAMVAVLRTGADLCRHWLDGAGFRSLVELEEGNLLFHRPRSVLDGLGRGGVLLDPRRALLRHTRLDGDCAEIRR